MDMEVSATAVASPALSPNIEVSFEQLPALDVLEGMWTALEAKSEPSIFQSWYWVKNWLATSNAQPKLLIARNKESIVGLALFNEAARRRFGRKVQTLYLQETGRPDLDSIFIEYNSILAATADKNIVMASAFEFLASYRQQGSKNWHWHEIHFSGVDELTKSQLEATPAYIHFESESRSFFVDLDSIRAAGVCYIDTRSRNTRQRINRALRLNERLGALDIRRAGTIEEAREFLQHLKHLHQSYWHSKGQPGAFSSHYFDIFHHTFLENFFASGVIDLIRLRAGDTDVGYLLNFVLGGTVYQYQSGFSYDQPKHLPGYVTHALAIQYYLEKGLKTYNFLAGENQQKASLCTGSEPLYWLALHEKPRAYFLEKLNSFEFLSHTRYDGASLPAYSKSDEAAPFKTPRKVLVMGDDVRSFLGTVRSLGRQGIVVDACPFNFATPALKSRYLRRLHRLPPYTLDQAAWIESLQRILETESYDLVIPCDDRNIIPLTMHRNDFSEQNIALPNAEAFDAFYDKHHTRQLAQRVNVPIAPGRLLRKGDTAQALAQEFGFPLAVKPRRSYLLDNPNRRQGVVICENEKRLDKTLHEIDDPETIFVEGFFEGYGVGISILANEGRVLQAFEHHRVQEPISGGGSSYRISHAVSPDMMRCVERLVKATDYTGVGMFEFRYNAETKSFILLEVNARFWGSLPLPIAAGVDFPYLLFRLLIDNFEAPKQNYQIGLYGRNVTADFYCTMENFSLLKRRSYLQAFRYLISSIAQWFRALTPYEKHDSFALDDVRPGLGEYQALFRTFQHALWKRVFLSAPLRVRHARKIVSSFASEQAEKNILVVCQGNICRSPFAGQMLKNKLAGFTNLHVASAGLMPDRGRQSPDLARAAAAAKHIDLTAHRSSYANQETLEQADLILLFDEVNEISLAERGGDVRAPVLRLGDLLDEAEGGGEILDPVDGGRDLFDQTYARIERACDKLTTLLGHPQA